MFILLIQVSSISTLTQSRSSQHDGSQRTCNNYSSTQSCRLRLPTHFAILPGPSGPPLRCSNSNSSECEKDMFTIRSHAPILLIVCIVCTGQRNIEWIYYRSPTSTSGPFKDTQHKINRSRLFSPPYQLLAAQYWEHMLDAEDAKNYLLSNLGMLNAHVICSTCC